MRKCRIGTAKFFTLLLLLYRTSVNNAGIPCCWYDPHGTALPEDLRIDYRITDLRQLYDIV